MNPRKQVPSGEPMSTRGFEKVRAKRLIQAALPRAKHQVRGTRCRLPIVAIAALLASHVTAAQADTNASFELQQLGGGTFESERDLADHPSIVFFHRLGQEASTKVFEELIRVHSEYQGDGVKVVAIVSGGTKRKQLAALKARKSPFRILLDPKQTAYRSFGVFVSPSVHFLDAKGASRLHYSGYRRDFALVARANLDHLLGRLSTKERDERIASLAVRTKKREQPGSVHYLLGLKLLQNGKRNEAQVMLMKAWQQGSVKAGVALGMIQLKNGEFSEAHKLLSEVVKFAPENPHALAAKGLALIRLGRKTTGIELLRSVEDRKLDEPLFYYELARASEVEGDKTATLRHYRRAAELLMANRRRRLQSP